MGKTRNSFRIALFIGVTYGFPLVGVLIVSWFGASEVMGMLLQGLRATTPSIAALITVLIMDGRAGLYCFLKERYAEHLKPVGILIAAVLPIMAFSLTAAICQAFFEIPVVRFELSGASIIIALWALIAEELGWRGFLQLALDTKLERWLTPLVIGLMWAAWHYHFALLSEMRAPWGLFTLGCVAESYTCYWLTHKSSGNIVPASVFHFVGNSLYRVFAVYPDAAGGSVLPYRIYVLCLVGVAMTITAWGVFSEERRADIRWRCSYDNRRSR